ncbi:MAG: 6-pyruvoyl-tetrahydropterin synthase-related protein [Candidatus Curtissbacteria bacterium]|nr:6-pyruvoyl-tetrahydropterin synthase-related protein [Candidatus Curtissbacteria bacterium]
MKFWPNPHFLSIFALLFFSVFALKSLSTSGFYTSHDGETHTARIAQYFIALSDWQIPPRHAASFYSGLGSPIFVYIYPLPYLLGSAVHVLGFSFANSFKIIMALGFVMSQVFAYLWFFEFFKSQKAAFLGALFYVWVPYRLSLVYVRGSLSELLAYTFLPLAFYALTKLSKQKNPLWIAISAVSISLILLSQNLVAAITLPVIFAYVIILSIFEKSIKYLALASIAFLWGLALSLVTYLPSLFEIKFTRFSETIPLAYANHFITLKQLISSPWGYGFDLDGSAADAMSFQIGLAHILILGTAIFLCTYFFVKKFPFVKKIGRVFVREVEAKSQAVAIFFIAAFLISVVLMLDIKATRSIWNDFKPLHTIDIPWRFLGISSLATAFLAAFVSKTVKSGLIFILAILAVVIANRNNLRINEPVFYSDSHFLNYTGSATQYGEFTPVWRQTTRVPIGIDPGSKIRSIPQTVDIIGLVASSQKITFDADVLSQTAEVRINKFYFPDTDVKVDGKKLKPFSDFSITGSTSLVIDKDEDGSGMLLIKLAKGLHHIDVAYKETTLRLFADILSLVAFVAALFVIVKYAKK